MNAHAPSLVWVIADGAPRHVSAFADLPPKRRPPVRCAQCDRRLTLKLGDVRRHHAAHEAGDVCSATRPETALHINCKLALAAALAAAARPEAVLSIVRRCAGDDQAPCDKTSVTHWLHGWDTVLIEHRVGEMRRPDLVLCRADTPIGAIEVVVSNAVSADKAEALAALNLPWVEVRGDSRLASPEGWSPRDPLPVVRASGEGEWRCGTHEAMLRAAIAATAEDEAAEQELQRHTSVLRAARVVDLYHDGGARERFIYRVTEQLSDGQVHSMQLQRGTYVVGSAPLTPADDPQSAAWPLLRVAFAADVKRVARNETSFADSPMRWAMGGTAEDIIHEALGDRVGRDPTPLATRYPRRWFYAKETSRWFLPADMRDVRWDRDAVDAFATHPAWARSRPAVRERPAPEGSWRTPVFASRPIAAMFLPTPATRAHGDAVAEVEVTRPHALTRRVIVVLERAALNETIEALARSLDADGVSAVWLSHPLDWCSALAPLAWAPAGRDARGHGGVVIDGLGVFRAEQFVRAFAGGDIRLTPEAIRRSLAARVRLMSRSM